MLGLGLGLQRAANLAAAIIRELREDWNTNDSNWQDANNNWESE